MKILFNRQELSNVITPLLCAVGKSTNASTEGILLEATEQDSCIMTTYDLEKGIRITVPCRVEEPGKCIINANKFSQTIRVMEGDEIELSVSEKMIANIVCGTSSHKMNALSAEDFPEIPRLSGNNGFILSQATLKKMFAKVSFAMGINDQRAVLNGCYVNITQDRLEMVSCDSFKLAKCSATVQPEKISNEAIDFRFIVPSKTVNELCRLLSDDEEEKVTVYVSHKNVVLQTEKLIIFSRLINGDYIDYNRFIIHTHKISIEVNRQHLLSALERAALITEDKVAGAVKSYVKLRIEGDLLKVLADSAYGSTYDEVPVTHEGEDLLIAFSNRYLMECMRASDAQNLRIDLSSPLAGINIQPADAEKNEEEEEFFMLLPVRIKE